MKKITLQEFVDWVADHKTMCEDFKNYFGFSIDQVKFSDVITCPVQEIDIAKDPDWLDVNEKASLKDDYDLYGFIDCKYGSNYTWFGLDQVGEPDTVLIIDDSNGSMSKLHLVDSRIKKKSKK